MRGRGTCLDRDHGDGGPEGVGAGGVAVVDDGVEVDVGEAQALEVLHLGHDRPREDEPAERERGREGERERERGREGERERERQRQSVKSSTALQLKL